MPFSLLTVTTPVHDLHASSCDYGHLFSFVPGDPSNPFVALWQADLVQAIVLAAGGLVLLGIVVGHARGQRGGEGVARSLGIALLAGAVASVILTGVALASSMPLTCGGAPGAAPQSSAEQQAYALWQTLNTLSSLMLYVTVLLLLGALIAGAVITMRGRRAAGVRG